MIKSSYGNQIIFRMFFTIFCLAMCMMPLFVGARTTCKSSWHCEVWLTNHKYCKPSFICECFTFMIFVITIFLWIWKALNRSSLYILHLKAGKENDSLVNITRNESVLGIGIAKLKLHKQKRFTAVPEMVGLPVYSMFTVTNSTTIKSFSLTLFYTTVTMLFSKAENIILS